MCIFPNDRFEFRPLGLGALEGQRNAKSISTLRLCGDTLIVKGIGTKFWQSLYTGFRFTRLRNSIVHSLKSPVKG
ncbi:hypothetical protein D3OALGB2SA_1756 [Olavius algarvensis associated proteobacterium Delta 3]|nr:hypothetical protein D3OALGB2SA_1756 [Olavius algarvensis associated proteobacterium Delta 3]